MIEGQSFLLTVIKNRENENNRFRRITVKEIINLKEITKIGYSNVHIEIDTSDSLKKLYEIIKEKITPQNSDWRVRKRFWNFYLYTSETI